MWTQSPPLHRLRRSPAVSVRGFTLIEVLIVITILAILIALLVPALGAVQTNARIVQVRADISALESGIARYKVDFNIEPPSFMILFERGADWNWTPPNTAAFSKNDIIRSRSLLRQLWPQFDFTIDRDVNNDGDANDYFVLAGAECLVLFLGGAPLWSDTNGNGVQDVGEVVPNGFSKNPVNPFAADGNRQGPYFELVASRMLASPAPTGSAYPVTPAGARAAGFFAYRDPLPSQRNPYAYLSSYSGQGYRAVDLGTGGLTDYYRQGTTATSPGWNATKYQIISPGLDGQYGTGGPYLSENWQTLLTGARAVEQDNITNFHSRTLSTK